jgi:hypothetical protein
MTDRKDFDQAIAKLIVSEIMDLFVVQIAIVAKVMAACDLEAAVREGTAASFDLDQAGQQAIEHLVEQVRTHAMAAWPQCRQELATAFMHALMADPAGSA